jgi:(acyl-carrier-protein) S-malonyltransferase
MLTPWLELPGVRSRMGWLSAVSGLDLVRLGTTAEAEEIRDTAVTQPLIVAFGLAVAAELSLSGVDATAGHSVGELTAAAVAGVFSPEAAVALASVRGQAMAAACAQDQTGMSAVLGGDPDTVVARLGELGLSPANRNGGGQIVAAGPVAALKALAAEPPSGARVIPLSVAGAFHTPYMASAENTLTELAAGVEPADPRRILLSNADGTAVSTGRQMMRRLVQQVTAPVRWDLCQDTLLDTGVTTVIELPPAGTLTGLARRSMKGVEVLALKKPEDLSAARDLIARAATAQAQYTPDWRVVVAPVKGTFHPIDLVEGSTVAVGGLLGTVRTKRDEHQVSASYQGVLVEWLLQEGDLVDAGEPLARLYPGTAGSA